MGGSSPRRVGLFSGRSHGALVMRNEAGVKDRCKKLFRMYEVWYTMPYQAGYSQAGVPDFICCGKGVFFAVECKFGRNKPTPRQVAQMEAVRLAGGVCLVINETNLHELEEYLICLGT